MNVTPAEGNGSRRVEGVGEIVGEKRGRKLEEESGGKVSMCIKMSVKNKTWK